MDEKDLKIEVCSNWPHGGQHVGTVPTWVKVTHVPTGLSVTWDEERSQLQNKAKATAELEKLLAAESDRRP